jgi:hypothetical protein
MARLSGRSGRLGRLPRLHPRPGRRRCDLRWPGALFRRSPGARTSWRGLALACLILGMVVSYAKARAEGLGMTCNVGIAERADRLVAVLHRHRVHRTARPARGGYLGVVLALLALASLITVVQRMLEVRRPGPGGWADRLHSAVGRITALLSDRLGGLAGYRLGWRAVRRMPERLAYADVRPGRRRGASPAAAAERMRSNYARVRPELDDAATSTPSCARACALPAVLLRGVPAPRPDGRRPRPGCGRRVTARCAR